MKPIYRCDYCNKMGTEEEIKEHEQKCTENYDRRNCYTCKYKKVSKKENTWFFTCEAGKEIPEGAIIEFCPEYIQKEKSDNILSNIFGDMFSSFCNN